MKAVPDNSSSRGHHRVSSPYLLHGIRAFVLSARILNMLVRKETNERVGTSALNQRAAAGLIGLVEPDGGSRVFQTLLMETACVRLSAIISIVLPDYHVHIFSACFTGAPVKVAGLVFLVPPVCLRGLEKHARSEHSFAQGGSLRQNNPPPDIARPA